jgi:hypothetical protein
VEDRIGSKVVGMGSKVEGRMGSKIGSRIERKIRRIKEMIDGTMLMNKLFSSLQ